MSYGDVVCLIHEYEIELQAIEHARRTFEDDRLETLRSRLMANIEALDPLHPGSRMLLSRLAVVPGASETLAALLERHGVDTSNVPRPS